MNQARFNIVDLFFEAAAKHPQKVAIIDKEKQISFSEFAQQVRETAAYFSSKGIAKGDKVLIFVPMSINLYRTVLALFHIGASAVFLDEWVSKKRMEVCCKIAQCKAFIGIFKARVLSFFSAELRKIPIKLGTGYNKNKTPVHIHTSASDTALITFTTGSTGTPKAAKRTHGFLQEQFNALIEKIEPEAEEIDMPALPIVLLINLGLGCTSIIANFKASKQDTMRPDKIYRQLKNGQVNRMVASPFFVKRLAKYMLANGLRLDKLKKVFTGGAPVFPSEAKIYDEAFPNARVEVVYGSTEAEPISSINVKLLGQAQADLSQKGLNVGVPYRKAEIKIIDIQDQAISCTDTLALEKLELPSGTIGEIIVSGPHVLREYVNNEMALLRNKIFIGDICWHRTGDSGYLENGMLYLCGKSNTLINKNNKIIAPFIYENYFQNMAGVEIGTILHLNNRLLALIEMNDNSKKKEVEAEIRSLELLFDKIIFLKKIPCDPRHNSKIDYELLKKYLNLITI